MTTKDKELVKASMQKAMAKASDGTMKNFNSEDFTALLKYYEPQIAQALPKHLTAERIIQQMVAMASRNPELKECTVTSFIGAMMQASILGFQPAPELGQCYFVPFENKKNKKKEVQLIIGYRGYIDLSYRTRELKNIYAYEVCQNDVFEYELGLEPKLKHIPATGDRGAITHFYAVAHFVNGGYAFGVQTVNDVLKHKKYSASGNSPYSPWNHSDHWIWMGKKTMVREIARWIPLSIDVRSALTTDGAVIDLKNFKSGGEVEIESLEHPDLANIEPANVEIQEDSEPQTSKTPPENNKPVSADLF